jgi:DNA-binding NarL/FixJ family response regulator
MDLGPTTWAGLADDAPAPHYSNAMKILIVDDHAVVREGVAAVLRGGLDAPSIVQAADIVSAIAMADNHPDLDMVLLDLSMPGVTGMAALDAFGARHGAVPVIVLSSSEDDADVRGAIAHGALGYVSKSAKPATLLAAVHLVASGEVYVPSFMARGQAPGSAALGRPANLTDRQRDVLQLVVDGAQNKEIAYRLAISEKTVKAHLTAIFRALNVTNRSEAARAAGHGPH